MPLPLPVYAWQQPWVYRRVPETLLPIILEVGTVGKILLTDHQAHRLDAINVVQESPRLKPWWTTLQVSRCDSHDCQWTDRGLTVGTIEPLLMMSAETIVGVAKRPSEGLGWI